MKYTQGHTIYHLRQKYELFEAGVLDGVGAATLMLNLAFLLAIAFSSKHAIFKQQMADLGAILWHKFWWKGSFSGSFMPYRSLRPAARHISAPVLKDL